MDKDLKLIAVILAARHLLRVETVSFHRLGNDLRVARLSVIHCGASKGENATIALFYAFHDMLGKEIFA